jgi:hypothetical protein
VPLALLFVIGVFVALSYWWDVTDAHANRELLGFLFGFLVAGFLAVIACFAITLSGGADWLTGAIAERWTARELAALGPEWRHYANVPFVAGTFDDASWEVDIDHLVVGNYGVLVVESKYCSSPIDLDFGSA